MSLNVFYIAHIQVPFGQANSVHIMKMCQAFQQEGHATTLIVPRPETLPALAEVWYHYGIQTPFDLHFISERGFIKPLIGWHVFALRAVLRAWRGQADVVYTRDIISAFWATRLGLPTIFETHAEVLPGRLGVGSLAVVRGRGFVRLVLITHALKQLWLEQAGDRISADQIVVAPDGVDLERFETPLDGAAVRAELGIPVDGFVAGYAGSLYPGRGIELLLDLARRLPRVVFLFVGGTEEEVEQRRCEATQMALRNVQFVGFVPNSDLPPYLAACNSLLMPYQPQVSVTPDGRGNTVHIMSPMKMFEYMAARRLIISSDLPVLHEVLNQSNAVLISPTEANAWQQALETTMADRDWADRLAEQAYRDVQHYTWRKRVQHVLSGL
jgi:glycosyltransferase involved in cell wall biosynthesis